MRVTIEKKTDQLNFEDFLSGVTRIVTIAGVKKGTKEQQYDIAIEGDARYWRPAVTVLKQLVAAWGDDATEWVGRRAELYGDPDVSFGGKKVGGIRVSRLSHIDKPVVANLSVTRGKREMYTVDPLPDAPTPPTADDISRATDTGQLKSWWREFPNLRPVIEARVNEIKAAEESTEAGDH